VLDEVGRQRTVNRAGARMMGFGDHGRFPAMLARSSIRRPVHRGCRDRVADRWWRGPGEASPLSRPRRRRDLALAGTLLIDVRDIEELRGFVTFSETSPTTKSAVPSCHVARSSVGSRGGVAGGRHRGRRNDGSPITTSGSVQWSATIRTADLRGFDIRRCCDGSPGRHRGDVVDEELARCAGAPRRRSRPDPPHRRTRTRGGDRPGRPARSGSRDGCG
jgi:hypothetical protein